MARRRSAIPTRQPDRAAGGVTICELIADALRKARSARDAARWAQDAARAARMSAGEAHEKARRTRAWSKALRRASYGVT